MADSTAPIAAEETAEKKEIDEEDSDSSSDSDSEESLPEDYDGPYKMVFVVNSSLGMGIGKIAAQVGHATLGAYRILLERREGETAHQLDYWEDYDGEKKIVLKGDTDQHLMDLEKAALEKGLCAYLVHDAGHTQVAAGSTTVLSIFGQECIVNAVTGKLKLL